MKVQLLSDLHLEMLSYKYEIANIDSDLIILAGDIGEGLGGVLWAIKESERLGKEILYIRGNHESWDHLMVPLYEQMKLLTEGTMVHIMENDVYEKNNAVFLCCTLWTDYMLYGRKARPEIMNMLANSYVDNLLINKTFPFTPGDSLGIHEKSLEWLRTNLMNLPSYKKKVVVTHHAPTIFAISPKYRFKDLLSPAFASDLEKFIIKTNPDYWFHGHTHFNTDLSIGKTKVISNQKGYPLEGYSSDRGIKGFDPARIIEI